MKEILLILVGGTICTQLNEKGTLSVSDKAGIWLTENFYHKNPEYKELVHFDLSENLLILSENMTVENWNVIIKTYQENIKRNKYDGVIFAHGTDTLAYSAALFSMLLSGIDIPVFFVSSNARLTSERANGNDNFRCATMCICKGITPNVYVAYKNISDNEMYIHLGSRIKQCENYSEDFFSRGAIKEKDFEKIDFPRGNALIDIDKEITLKECVLMINPYVGINYDVYDYSKFKAVLHGSFHSGTACTEKNTYSESYGKNSVLYMIDKCEELNADTYLSPATLGGEIYETVDIIRNHTESTKFMYGCTTEVSYAKLLIAYSIFDNPKDIEKFIDEQINFERTE